jgi:hypothetical protein
MQFKNLFTILFLFAIIMISTVESLRSEKVHSRHPRRRSDMQLKNNIKQVGKLENGLGLYEWTWNTIAEEKFNLTGVSNGVMAQEVQIVMPAAVEMVDGYLKVNYAMVFPNGEYARKA